MRPRWWEWPQALSLEAPLVAWLWLQALAEVHQVWMPAAVSWGLVLAVWWIYGVDRLLDGWRTARRGSVPPTARHATHWRCRRWLLVGVLPMVTGALVWLGLWRVPEGLMWKAALVAGLAVFYLVLYVPLWRGPLMEVGLVLAAVMMLELARKLPVEPADLFVAGVVVVILLLSLFLRHFSREDRMPVPKEVVGGLLFALGVCGGVDFYGGALPLDTLQLAALFGMNLLVISLAEAETEAETARLRQWLVAGWIGVIVIHGIVGRMMGGETVPREVLWGVGVGAGLMALLLPLRRVIPVSATRTLADAAVVIAALVTWWLG
ncbi:MAG: hypothetical protein KDK99_12085 [Verrucomicrobiales bacterium]|nr:hypothetical protein [Verrucomicrobiales bacterium]